MRRRGTAKRGERWNNESATRLVIQQELELDKTLLARSMSGGSEGCVM